MGYYVTIIRVCQLAFCCSTRLNLKSNLRELSPTPITWTSKSQKSTISHLSTLNLSSVNMIQEDTTKLQKMSTSATYACSLTSGEMNRRGQCRRKQKRKRRKN